MFIDRERERERNTNEEEEVSGKYVLRISDEIFASGVLLSRGKQNFWLSTFPSFLCGPGEFPLDF